MSSSAFDITAGVASQLVFKVAPASTTAGGNLGNVTVELQDGRTSLVIHEANLVDYARMSLRGSCIECRVLRMAKNGGRCGLNAIFKSYG